VLGLSLTSTAVGWVLVEGHDADGAIVDHDDFAVRTGGAGRAVKTAVQVTAAVLSACELATRHDQRVRMIGLTWSDDTAAEAALLLESLTDAGFDNVVPIALLHATEMLAQGIAPVVGYDRTAVCMLDGEAATVAMVDGAGEDTQTAVKYLPGGPERLLHWLTRMFDRSPWQPSGVVVVGSEPNLDVLSSQLEKALPVPVFTQSGAPLALARGAALASASSTEFTDIDMVESIEANTAAPAPSASRSYAGALTMLAAGAVTFVASLSLAVGPWLIPDRSPGPVEHAMHKSASPVVVEAPGPPPPPAAVPIAQAAPEPAPPEEEPALDLLERLHGQPSDPAPDEPAPGPPPNPGVPAP
ncbi:MAG: DUF7159 family protein, partial [Mycobacterium sp.]